MAGGTRHLPAILLSAALLLVSATALAGDASDPEVTDPRGDLATQWWDDPDLTEEAPTVPTDQLPAVNTSADLVAAWVAGESEDAFLVSIQVADLPEHENISGPLADLKAHFRVLTQDYTAQSLLSVPAEEQRVEATYELLRGDQKIGELNGAVDLENDRVTVLVPKAWVGDPGEGDQLTRFHATSHLPGTSTPLDWAPDPETGVGDDLLNPDVGPQPTYGTEYAFGAYQGDVAAALDVRATPEALELTAGEAGKVSIRLINDATAEDTVQLTVESAPDGWSLRFEQASLTVQPGQSQTTVLHVDSHEEARGQDLVTLRVVSTLGADHEIALSLEADPAPSPPPAGGQGTGDGGTGDQGASSSGSTGAATGGDGSANGASAGEEENGAPMPGAIAALAGLAATALLTQRRRR